MSNLNYISKNALMRIFLYQMTLQAQLLEAQQEIIDLQKQLLALKPDTPDDKEVFWHVKSNGQLSIDAAESDRLEVVQAFLDWNISLANEHVKPYVNPKVYGEVLNQMTRGLPEKISDLKTEKEIKDFTSSSNNGERIIQLALLQDA